MRGMTCIHVYDLRSSKNGIVLTSQHAKLIDACDNICVAVVQDGTFG